MDPRCLMCIRSGINLDLSFTMQNKVTILNQNDKTLNFYWTIQWSYMYSNMVSIYKILPIIPNK
jgi:hypothetical protein